MTTRTDRLQIRLEVDGEGQVHAALVNEAKDVDQLADSTERATRSTSGLSSAVKALAAAASVRWALHTMVDMERLHAMLRTVTGSTEAATVAWSKLNTMAATTPFQLSQITKGYIGLKNFGIDPLNGTLHAIIEQSAALGASQETLNGIILAVGQAWGKEKLQGQEILQLVNQGVPVWGLLEKALGKTSAQLHEMSQKGELGRSAIAALVREMGKMNAGAAAQQMQTLGGALSNLHDQATRDIDALDQSGLGHALTNLVHGLTAVITPGTQVNAILRDALPIITGLLVANKLGPAFTALGGRVLGFASSLATAAGRAAAMEGALAALGGPAGILIGAAAALGTWIATMDSADHKTSELVDQVDRLIGKYKELDNRERAKTLKELNEQAADLQAKIAAINSVPIRRINSAGQVEALRKQLDLILKKRQQLDDYIKKSAEHPTTSNSNKPTSGGNAGDTGASDFDKRLSKLRDQLDPVAAKTRAYMQAVADLDRAWATGKISGDEHDKLINKLATDTDAMNRAQQKRAQVAGQLQDVVASTQTAEQRLNATYAQRQAVLQASLDNGTISQSKYQQLSERLEARHQDQLNSIRYRGMNAGQRMVAAFHAGNYALAAQSGIKLLQIASGTNKNLFELTKKASLGQTIISGALAAQQSLTNAGGWPWGIPAMLASLAQTAVKVETIKSQTFGGGGSVPSGGGGGVPSIPIPKSPVASPAPAGPIAATKQDVAPLERNVTIILPEDTHVSTRWVRDKLAPELEKAAAVGAFNLNVRLGGTGSLHIT